MQFWPVDRREQQKVGNVKSIYSVWENDSHVGLHRKTIGNLEVMPEVFGDRKSVV